MHPIISSQLARVHAEGLRRGARRRSGGRSTRRSARRVTTDRPRRAESNEVHAWVLSLPWVVERPYELAPGVRTFVVDCPPLAIRRLWLVTGLGSDGRDTDIPQISVIVPCEISSLVEHAGWGRAIANMPAGHVLMGADADAETTVADVQALVLTGYRYAMA